VGAGGAHCQDIRFERLTDPRPPAPAPSHRGCTPPESCSPPGVHRCFACRAATRAGPRHRGSEESSFRIFASLFRFAGRAQPGAGGRISRSEPPAWRLKSRLQRREVRLRGLRTFFAAGHQKAGVVVGTTLAQAGSGPADGRGALPAESGPGPLGLLRAVSKKTYERPEQGASMDLCLGCLFMSCSCPVRPPVHWPLL